MLLSQPGCIFDADCGICDPQNLVLESISGVNYASKKIHVLGPDCEGERCRDAPSSGKYFVEDLKSSNGTFVRARGSVTLPSGSLILLGKQPFRIDIG